MGCITMDGNTVYVGGWATLNNNRQAVMWVGNIPSPGAGDDRGRAAHAPGMPEPQKCRAV
jgi:hypothetical protein